MHSGGEIACLAEARNRLRMRIAARRAEHRVAWVALSTALPWIELAVVGLKQIRTRPRGDHPPLELACDARTSPAATKASGSPRWLDAIHLAIRAVRCLRGETDA